ncbi:MAG: glycoside hydrolase family 95 protein, partial [Oscillospiraceae bacterium]
GNGGVTYVTQVHGRSNGSFEQIGDFLGFTNASEVEIFVIANTDYHTKDPQAECAIQRENLEKKTYEELKDEHVKDYQKLYNRVNLTLSDKESPLPTNKRLENVKNGNKDRGLIELYFNFGRYMMISASRPNSMAMNLQGIWNNEYAPRWESNYTININTEMNYWPAEVCNLSECHEPMFDLIDKMFENGKRTAKEMYGCNGFMAHHCTDLWGDTAVEGVFFPSPCWPMGGAWMSLHLWESFLYSGDVEFLKNRAYPILKEAAVFFTEYMIKDKDGLYVTGPTLSPENTYILPNGDEGSLCMGAEMDNQIVRELFNSVINASEILDIDKDLSSTLKEMLSKIREPRINSYGGIMEWSEDYGELEPGHRHMSQMFALHPGSQINPLDTPSLAKACEGTLNHRLQNGGGHTGWSCAWIVNMYARLWKGEQAEEFFYKLLSESTLPNLFDCHPPFQIDGNFGGTAAIAEMLMQSHMHEINILPALPKSWESGSVIGLRARGGFTVSIWWEENKPKTVKITASKDGEIRVRIAEGFVADTEYSYENGCILFNCVAGNEYTLTK